MRPLLLLACAVDVAAAQGAPLARADSALIHGILVAEDARDAAAPALAEGRRHPDPRVRLLAARAAARIADAAFAARDSLPLPAPAPEWPEPAWKARYRALAERRDDCATLRGAIADSVVAVRLRALDLVTSACAHDTALVASVRRSLPVPAAGRSWHTGARALVALARVAPEDAGVAVRAATTHPVAAVRAYVARAAQVLGDTAIVRTLVADRDPNVAEVAIGAYARLRARAADTLLAAVLATRSEVAPVRAAAVALRGTDLPAARDAADAAYRRWRARDNHSERDVRVALLAAAGRPTDGEPVPAPVADVPGEAVALALGAEVRLRVTMAALGGFTVRLRGDVAPVMAARILHLVRRGYYDGLTWHRVEHDFVIQGGSPGANEYVGLPRYLRDELHRLPHPRGTVGMSTRGHDTGDAQWFVNLRDNPRLLRDYTVFAEVVEGMDVVDGVLEGDVISAIREVAPR